MKIMNSVRSKMIVIFVPLLIVAVLIVGLLAYNIARRSLLEAVRTDLDSYVQQFYTFLEANPDMDFDVIEKLCNKDIVIGKSGFIFIVDTKGNLLIHKKAPGENWADKPHIKEIITKREGRIRYISPKTHTYKIASYKYLKDFDWIIVASAFEDDFLAGPRAALIRNLSVMGIIIVIIGTLLILFFTALLVKPLSMITETAEEVASQADLTRKIKVASRDEIGKLAGAFNGIIESTHSMVLRIRNSADKVASSSQDLSSSSQEVNASTQQIANSIQQISKGVTVQAQKTEEISKIVQEATISMRKVTSNAQQAATASQQASTRAKEGRKATTDTVERMEEIADVVNTTTEVIKSLSQQSQQISEINETVASIADQTNLLALNAAIEAARAGEAGRGFAVVAEEIRKLAESSAEAAGKISGLIRKIQTMSQEAVVSAEAGSKKVIEGKNAVNKASQALDEIIKSVEHIAAMVNEIAVASQQQLKSTERIETAVGEVANIAEESASAAQETSSSIEEQSASMEEMATSAGGLARLAIELKESVVKFRLKEGE